MEFYTTVDDDLYEELCELVEQKVVYFELWEDSLADELEKGDKSTDVTVENSFDIDLYLDGGVYFELYGTLLFTSLDAEPLEGQDATRKMLAELVRKGLTLSEVALNEDDGLVLVLAAQGKVKLYCSIGGWLLDEWDELPE